MDVGGRHWPLLYSVCVLVATAVASGTAAEGLPSEPALLAPEVPRSLGTVDESPLVELFNRPQPTPGSTASKMFPGAEDDVPAVVLIDFAKDGPSALEPPAPEPAPTRTASPAPEPVPTAVAAEAARLILGDFPDPIGDGDWRAARAAIGAFYAARGFEPIWVDRNGPTRAGRAVLAQLRRAADDGINLSGPALPNEVVSVVSPDDLARTELAIAAAVVAYAELASGSRIAPSRISPLFGAAPSVAEPGDALAETSAAADPGARLAAFNPPQKGYRELRDELKRLADPAPGEQRRASIDVGADLTGMPIAASDAALEPDSRLGSLHAKKGSRRSRAYAASADATLRSSVARRRAAILANMEMWRWEPREMGARRIEVNIPDFSVTVFEGDTVVHNARVVVGKPQTPTPVFSNVMRYVLINPEWQVPDSIVKKEILPRLGHFESLGYQVKTIGGRVTVRQPPGDDNALGRLAFMFPNEHSVYLHDTPARELFSEDIRALSHGCVRVEDPMRLAELVLGWPESRISAAIGGPERTVFLPQPLPIHIEYFTDFVDEDGILQERPDVYGLTQKVAVTLSATS